MGNLKSETKKSKKAHVNKKACVACGVCRKACPQNAISIYYGVCSKVNVDMCVGCGICASACPADAISVEVLHNDKK